MKVEIQGTFQELSVLYEQEKLCTMLGIDPYKLCLVPEDEIFHIGLNELGKVFPALRTDKW